MLSLRLSSPFKCCSLLPTSTSFHTSGIVQHIIAMTRVRVVDNSALGKEAGQFPRPVRCIRVYNKQQRGTAGDMLLVAIRGLKKKAWCVGSCLPPRIKGQPKFDSNNVVLLNDDLTPMGTRILVPIPSHLRGQKGDISKILAIATKFV